MGNENKNIQFYESFIYGDEAYFLYDNVYIGGKTEYDTSIGKIVQIFGTAEHEKKVEVIRLFHHNEIRQFLRDYEPRWNELFLACGKGCSNIYSVDKVAGKCGVFCVSSDRRNPQVSKEQTFGGYIFSKCFDVGQRRMIEKFEDEINGIKVELLFNKEPKDTTPTDADDHRERKKFCSNCRMVKEEEAVLSERVGPQVASGPRLERRRKRAGRHPGRS